MCNAIFSVILGSCGYDQTADIAMGIEAQSGLARSAISVSYIWIETIGFAIGAILILLFTVENRLKQDQANVADEY